MPESKIGVFGQGSRGGSGPGAPVRKLNINTLSIYKCIIAEKPSGIADHHRKEATRRISTRKERETGVQYRPEPGPDRTPDTGTPSAHGHAHHIATHTHPKKNRRQTRRKVRRNGKVIIGAVRKNFFAHFSDRVGVASALNMIRCPEFNKAIGESSPV
jgi:hypothetical protein